MDRQEKSIGADGDTGRAWLLAGNGRTRLTSRIGSLESVESFVVESTNPTGRHSRAGRGGCKSRRRSGRVVEGVRKGPSRVITRVNDRLTVVTSSDELGFGSKGQGQVWQTWQSDRDVCCGGFSGRGGVDNADGRVMAYILSDSFVCAGEYYLLT